MGWASFETKPHECIWNDDSSQLGLAVLNDGKAKLFIEGLSCAAYIRCQFRQTDQPCLFEKVLHEESSNTASTVITGHKEVVNVPAGL